MSDQAVADDLNEKRYSGPLTVSYDLIAREFDLDLSDRFITSVRAMAAVKPTVDEMSSRMRSPEGIEVSFDVAAALLGGMVQMGTTGGITQADADVILAIAQNAKSRADLISWGEVTAAQVAKVKAWSNA